MLNIKFSECAVQKLFFVPYIEHASYVVIPDTLLCPSCYVLSYSYFGFCDFIN